MSPELGSYFSSACVLWRKREFYFRCVSPGYSMTHPMCLENIMLSQEVQQFMVGTAEPVGPTLFLPVSLIQFSSELISAVRGNFSLFQFP